MMLTEIKLQIRGQLFRYSLVLIRFESLEFQSFCVGGKELAISNKLQKTANGNFLRWRKRIYETS